MFLQNGGDRMIYTGEYIEVTSEENEVIGINVKADVKILGGALQGFRNDLEELIKGYELKEELQ